MAEKPGNENVTKQDTDIHCGHDGVTRGFLDEKEVAASFLKEYLPAEITRELDFKTLRVSKDTFVDRKISRYFADILYEIKLRDSLLFIYLLFEHKSAEEKMVGFQFLQYMVKIWEKYLKQNRNATKLPPIFPILIYHGEKEWKVETRFIYLFDVPAYLEKYIPDFSFNLYDISHLPDEEIKGVVLLRIFLLTLKYIFNPELRDKLGDILQLFKELEDKSKASEYLEMLLRYLVNSAENIPEDQLRESLEQILEKGGDMMATLAQKWKEQGKDEGIEIGIEEGIEIGKEEGSETTKWTVARKSLKMGFNIASIAEITGLPEEKIRLLASKMNIKKTGNQ
jgi:predicted transposase/invertase (TIGR01784 family)